jgi:hypothetical protein
MKANIKKQCPNCSEMPAWYIETDYGFDDVKEELITKPVYKCGLCNFKLPRKIYNTKRKQFVKNALDASFNI